MLVKAVSFALPHGGAPFALADQRLKPLGTTL